MRKDLQISIKYLLLYRFKEGGLAQLASAFDWQSKGHGFESRILHRINLPFVFSINQIKKSFQPSELTFFMMTRHGTNYAAASISKVRSHQTFNKNKTLSFCSPPIVTDPVLHFVRFKQIISIDCQKA